MAARKKTDTVAELPFRQIDQFWNWLPAFRAVAETGGINEAARQLRLSPSALSRSVACLEGALGEQLFHREAGLVLTAAGQRLLVAAREAMRGVHEATRTDFSFGGPVHVATTSRIGLYRLLPALRELRQSFPHVEPHVRSVQVEEVEPLLLRGALDLAIVMETTTPRALAGTPLTPASCHVYCGKRHPLFGVRAPDEAKVSLYPFAAPAAHTGSLVPADSWPAALPRTVALRSDTIEPAIDACVEGELLTCLPDEIVDALGLVRRFRALPRPELPSTPLLCLTRKAVGPRPTLAGAIAKLLA